MELNRLTPKIVAWGLAQVMLMLVCMAPAFSAQVPSTINYQGYLTNSSGVALDGSYTLTFELFDAATAGASEWGPETHTSVPVARGIFHVALGSVVALQPNDFDKALFLNVKVNGESMTPRQPLQTVPYAFGLVPGAEIQGDPTSGNYALRVDNEGTGSTDRGLYVKGEQYGLYAEEVGADSDVGIYSPDFVHAEGYRSDSDSHLWVPGTAAMLYPTTGCALYPEYHGSARLQCSASGTKSIHIPITVPGVLMGQDLRVVSVTVYYDLDHTGSYISSTGLYKLTAAGASQTIVFDPTDRTSTSAANYRLYEELDNTVLGSTAGALNLRLAIAHDGDTTHDVIVGGVRVQLRHYPIPE